MKIKKISITLFLIFCLGVLGFTIIKPSVIYELSFNVLFYSGRQRMIADIKRTYGTVEILDVRMPHNGEWSTLFQVGQICYRVWYSVEGDKVIDGPIKLSDEGCASELR